MNIENIKFNELWVRPRDKEKLIVNNLIDKDDLTGSGAGVCEVFEKCFGEYIGSRYCLTYSHGTQALAAAYYAAGIGPGDEVITPGLGYLSSYAGAMFLGARPIFCDISEDTLLIDPESARKKITKRTKAINIIHMNGRVCDMDAFFKLSKEYGLAIIEDAAHATGAEWGGVKIGNFNHVTCFSLQGVNPFGKPVAGGEGGVICTNDPVSFQRLLAYSHLHRKNLLALLADGPYSDLDAEALGFKSRAHPLALGLAFISLGSIEYRNKQIAECYSKTVEILKEFDFIRVPTVPAKAKMGGYYEGFQLVYDPAKLGGTPLPEFLAFLKDRGIPAFERKFGYLEYKRSIFTKGFDLWGRNRGPIGEPWEGMERYPFCKVEDFPVTESLLDRVFRLRGFIEVDPEYYPALKAALEEVRALKGGK